MKRKQSENKILFTIAIVSTVKAESKSNSVRNFDEFHKFINFSCERLCSLRHQQRMLHQHRGSFLFRKTLYL